MIIIMRIILLRDIYKHSKILLPLNSDTVIIFNQSRHAVLKIKFHIKIDPPSLSWQMANCIQIVYCGEHFNLVTIYRFIPDDTTLTEKMVQRTTIPLGTFSYPVPMLVTPALMVRIQH